MVDFTKKNQIMGILNVTPDSFSDGGRYAEVSQAVARGKELVAQGADILDIGGQSTRPGYEAISPQAELERILPVIEELKKAVTVPISVDTFYPEVAEAVIAAGADIINDIKGLDFPGMAEVLAAHPTVGIVLMHSRKRTERSLIEDIQRFYDEKIQQCQTFGIDQARLCFDPGLGFHKTPAENLAILKEPAGFRYRDLPLLFGISRKRTIGAVTGETVAEKRDYASVQASLFALEKGVEIVRVHEVFGMKQALVMQQTLVEGDE
ncbi:dihydropteroate synthase [Enterococcus sp. CSURQ0835]|uniref:dihydropteroate synthase n=1 Tax=Enterococcus sp. CSURQ0835 TaxID=2681394 RepID=UPI0013573EEC|nr:dihydropteroate synthase [Enterococcus sp. CSURQ0835]